MSFDEVLAQVLELLQREGRLSYRALKRRFSIDDEYLEDLKTEIIRAKRLAIDEDGAVLVWTGSPSQTATSSDSTTRSQFRYARGWGSSGCTAAPYVDFTTARYHRGR